MSRIWSAEAVPATPVGGFGDFGTFGRQGGSFRTIYGDGTGAPAWSAAQPGAMRDSVGGRGEEEANRPDPVEEAAKDGFLQGFREGERIGREAAEADNASRLQLAAAIQHIAQTGEGTLAAMLSQAVVRLVGEIMGHVAIDEDLLRQRCAAVAACIDTDEAGAVIEVNPEDMPLLESEPLGVALSPNAELPRGSVRLATADGWVEDGPDVRLARLKALLDDMEGRR